VINHTVQYTQLIPERLPGLEDAAHQLVAGLRPRLSLHHNSLLKEEEDSGEQEQDSAEQALLELKRKPIFFIFVKSKNQQFSFAKFCFAKISGFFAKIFAKTFVFAKIFACIFVLRKNFCTNFRFRENSRIGFAKIFRFNPMYLLMLRYSHGLVQNVDVRCS
jgi:hypothetical protein